MAGADGVEFWRLYRFCVSRLDDKKAGTRWILTEAKLTLGLDRFNADEHLGPDAEVLELLVRCNALMNGERDPIFREEDEAEGVIGLEVEGASDQQWA